jgi:hypothetical protein
MSPVTPIYCTQQPPPAPRVCAEMPMTQADYSMHVPWFHHRWSDSQLHFVTHPTNKWVMTGAYLNVSRHIKMAHCCSGCCHTLWLYKRLTYESIRKLLFVYGWCLSSVYMYSVGRKSTDIQTYKAVVGVYTVLPIAHNWYVFSFYYWYQK